MSTGFARQFGGRIPVDPWVAIVSVAVGVWCLFPDVGHAENEAVESEIESLKEELDESAGDASSDVGRERDAGSNSREDVQGRDAGDTESAEPSVGGSAGEGGRPESTVSTFVSLYFEPLLCATLAGLVLGLLGVYVVARRIVFVTAALSQVSALGITGGFLVVGVAGLSGWLATAVPAGLAAALSLVVVFALTSVGESESYPRDAVLGTAFVVPMALVLVLGPYIPQEMHEIRALLHGSAVVVRTFDLWAIALAGLAVVVTQVVGFRGFVFATLDPTVARTQGVPVGWLDAALFGSIAVMVGLSTRALGALPTFALTVLPAIGALRLEYGLPAVFAAASLGGAVSGGVGYGVAYAMDWSVGASQALTAAAVLVVLRTAGHLIEGRRRPEGDRVE